MTLIQKMSSHLEYFWIKEKDEIIDYWNSIALLPLSEAFDILIEISKNTWKKIRFIHQTSLKTDEIELFICKEYDYSTFMSIYLLKYYLIEIIVNFENPKVVNWINSFMVDKSNFSNIYISENDLEWIIALLKKILTLLSSKYQEYICASTEEDEINSDFEHIVMISKKEMCQIKNRSIANILWTNTFNKILSDCRINLSPEWLRIITKLEIMRTLYLWC